METFGHLGDCWSHVSLLLCRISVMKLLTHNMLTSKCLKGVQVGYPLKIIVSMTLKW